MSVVRKEFKSNGNKYMVSRNDFPDGVTYEAWEPASIEKSMVGFISKQSHAHIYKSGDELWGDIATRALPERIETMTPRSDERRRAEHIFHENNCLLACDVINEAFKIEDGAVADNGSYVLRKKQPTASAEPPLEGMGRSVIDDPRSGDDIKDMLSMMAFDKLSKFAEANGVMVKPGDTPGLLKMRVGNALRHKAKKGETIVKV